MPWLRIFAACGLAGVLSACATTTPNPAPSAPNVPAGIQDAPIAQPAPTIPDPTPDPTPDPIPAPTRPILIPAPSAPLSPPENYQSGFSSLEYWNEANLVPALRAFQNSCKKWTKFDGDVWLDSKLKQYGQIKDWQPACQAAMHIRATSIHAKSFFQTYFEPITISNSASKEGLLTGYYAPQISVRRRANSEFSEPILARPKNKSIQNLARKDLNHNSSRVLAYGRPVDVFFLQIQGSGNIKFPDGKIYMAAFDGHNSRKYKSIGSVLLKRGALSKHKASKQDIENWMKANGAKATRDLMNENPRYIFFKTKTVYPGVGPLGAMRVPLVGMGSMAVDPRYHPYGSLVWLNVKLPTSGGDYKGTRTGILLNAQDTGGAIKGAARGDLYFGEGFAPGAKAGVMKHRAIWTLLLPVPLALKLLSTT